MQAGQRYYGYGYMQGQSIWLTLEVITRVANSNTYSYTYAISYTEDGPTMSTGSGDGSIWSNEAELSVTIENIPLSGSRVGTTLSFNTSNGSLTLICNQGC